MKKKKEISDEQFKNQVIFTIKGMQANLEKINKMFPITEKCINVHTIGIVLHLDDVIAQIKGYSDQIVRKP